MSELDLFSAALAAPDAVARADLLDRECGGDPALRARLDKLLAAHFALPPASGRADPQPPGSAVVTEPDGGAPGTVVAGRYKLIERIGEGGMGEVWTANQTEPVRRTVALKLVRADRGQSKAILARFEAERQAIALMDHPNIARLLDAGATAAGAPFFVMELVKGVPLTEYCDTHRLSVTDRLALFRQTCAAVQHAHQKGIIHRDLKPGNILVESHDGVPAIKVIDFGLAKATSGLELTDLTLLTGFGSVMGTPLYMAPEQATFNAVDVDTRADVYALGVVLYELLTGGTPLARDTVRKAALDEVLKLIREAEPPSPSSRLDSSADAPRVATNRQTEPAKLGRFVKGELDWIALKALAKERNRRYESAADLAADVSRFLNHEPVAAGPPARWYKARKFVRRHRAPVAAAALVLLALVAGVVGTTAGWLEARRQTGAAETERANAVAAAGAERDAKNEAEARRREAERNLNYSRKANDILAAVFTDLDPKANYATAGALRDALKNGVRKAAADLDETAVGDPLVVADLQNKLGQSLFALGEAADARTLLERGHATRAERLGRDHPDTLRSANNLAFARQATDGPRATIPQFEDLLARRTATLGPDHPDTLNSMNNLGYACLQAGLLDRATELFERTHARRTALVGAEHPDTLVSLNNLATARYNAGQFDRSAALHRQAYDGYKSALGADHPETNRALHNLAVDLQSAGKLSDAVPLFEQALAGWRATLGADHPDTLTAMTNLGFAYHLQKRYDRALPLLEEALRRREARLGKDHRDTLSGMSNLALAFKGDGQTDKAVPLLERAAERMAATLGPDNTDTQTAQVNLAAAYRESGTPEKAVPLLERVLERQRATLGKDHQQVFSTTTQLANTHKAAGKHDLAIPLYKEVLERRTAILGDGDPATVASLGNLGAAYAAAARHADAVPVLEQFVTRQRKLLPAGRLASLLHQVGPEMTRCGRPDLAEGYLREALATREATEPDAWSTADTRSLLGSALLAQKKYTDAEPLLVKGYDGLRAKANDVPRSAAARLPATLDQLVELYTATGKPDDAKKYQELRAKHPTPKNPLPPGKP